MAPKYTNKIFDNRLYRDSLARLAHASFIVALAVDYLFGTQLDHTYGVWFWVILGLGAAYNVVPFLISKLTVLTHSVPSLVYHFALIGLLIIFFVPPGSAFNWITLALLSTAIYWVGTPGFLIGGVGIATMFYLAMATQTSSSPEDMYQLSIKIFLLFAFGGLLLRLTEADRRERQQLVEFSEEAAFERERLRSLINSMGDAVIATNKKGEIQLYNGTALNILNTNINLEGKNINDVLNLLDEENKHTDVVKIAKKSQGVVKRDDLHIMDVDSSEVDLYISIAPIYLRFDEETEGGLIFVFRDITKEKTLEEQRDEFVSVASHELRTPIAITEANISTALLPSLGKLDKKRKALLEQAHHNVLFLADLVNDLTTVARTERGDLDMDIEKVDVVELAETLVRDYQRQARDKGIELKLNNPAKKIMPIMSNQHRVREILQNLVTNALKYTKQGQIKVSIEADGKRGGVLCKVADTGIGISKSDQKHLFSKFWRSEDFRTQESSGTGLGLYISWQLTKRLGGKIWLESKLNNGTIFYVWLPRKVEVKQETRSIGPGSNPESET